MSTHYGISCWSEGPDYQAIYTFTHNGLIIARPMDELNTLAREGATTLEAAESVAGWIGRESRWRAWMPRVVFSTEFAITVCGWEKFHYSWVFESGQTSLSGKSQPPPLPSAKIFFPSD